MPAIPTETLSFWGVVNWAAAVGDQPGAPTDMPQQNARSDRTIAGEVTGTPMQALFHILMGMVPSALVRCSRATTIMQPGVEVIGLPPVAKRVGLTIIDTDSKVSNKCH
ncbi:MAG: hypothetical protein AVO35_06105 [Candidatus Aegiribacteria sp. MLS_C]|nr:MAG: hypothetical protein AVO35_06105 [Candidatus Aegiribacteria sp. MLS_C]